MIKKLLIYLQYALPQHALSVCIGKLANLRIAIFKNAFITWFCKKYQVDLSEAIYPTPDDYLSFNDFFTRRLQPNARPIATDPNVIVAPVDGCISQLGSIAGETLLQAKGQYYSVATLLAEDKEMASHFANGRFATFYLSPRDYHRVHMPATGKLCKTIFVPGRLFSVNPTTAETVSNLFTRNERLVCLFTTEIGYMAIIFVGALIVSSIKPIWQPAPIKSKKIDIKTYANVQYEKGSELGLFQLGSTVIVLFERKNITWVDHLKIASCVQFGQGIAYKH